jgi:hypothetical protein
MAANEYCILIGSLHGGSVEIVENVTKEDALKYARELLTDGTAVDEIHIVVKVPLVHTQTLDFADESTLENTLTREESNG